MMKYDPMRKPTCSNKSPATDGPTDSPKAKLEFHSPLTSPNVFKLSGNPQSLIKTVLDYIDAKNK